jgi:hypothetical protein
MECIIKLLQYCNMYYKNLEIPLEETPQPAQVMKAKLAEQISLNAALISNGYTGSSSSDDQDAQADQPKQKKKKKKTMASHTSCLMSTAVLLPLQW